MPWLYASSIIRATAHPARPRPRADGRIPYPMCPARSRSGWDACRSAIPPRARPPSVIHQYVHCLSSESRRSQDAKPAGEVTSSLANNPNPSSCRPGPHSLCASSQAECKAAAGVVKAVMLRPYTWLTCLLASRRSTTSGITHKAAVTSLCCNVNRSFGRTPAM